jgi:hypothetical protein
VNCEVSFYSGFRCLLNRFGLVRFNRFKISETETEPNRTDFFLGLFNRFIRFFFNSVFSIIFFCFFLFNWFFSHP